MRLRPTKRDWFRIHGWIGVQLGVVLFVVLFSGTLATVGHELDWLSNPALRVTPQAETVPLSRIASMVEQRYPEAELWFLRAPLGRRFAAEAQVLTVGEGGFTERVRRVYIDPYRGTIQGEASWFTLQRSLRNFHMNLSLPAFGIYLVSAVGFFLLVSTLSALFFYAHWWRKFFVLRLTRGTRIFWSDLHRATGLWTLWFTLLMALTGVWYFAEMGMFDTGNGLQDVPGGAPRVAVDAADKDRPRASPAELLRATETAFPELDVTTVVFPSDATDAVRVYGHAEAWLVRDRANNVFLNPYTAEVMAVYRGEELPLAHRWMHTADPLHFGDFGGLVSKLIWFVFGLGASTLTLTGTYLWLRRLQQRGADSSPTVATP